MCSFEIELRYILKCVPRRQLNGLCLTETCHSFVKCQEDCWLVYFPQKLYKTQKTSIVLPRILSRILTFWVAQQEVFWSKPWSGEGFLLWQFPLFWIILKEGAQRALLNFASSNKSSFSPERGCFKAISQPSLSVLFLDSKDSWCAVVRWEGVSAISKLYYGLTLSPKKNFL